MSPVPNTVSPSDREQYIYSGRIDIAPGPDGELVAELWPVRASSERLDAFKATLIEEGYNEFATAVGKPAEPTRFTEDQLVQNIEQATAAGDMASVSKTALEALREAKKHVGAVPPAASKPSPAP